MAILGSWWSDPHQARSLHKLLAATQCTFLRICRQKFANSMMPVGFKGNKKKLN
jgi:hypothetical protein